MVSAQDDGSFSINSESFSNAYYWDIVSDANTEFLELSVFVNPTTPIGHIAEFEIIINQLNTDYESSITFSMPVGQVIENFESNLDNLGWGMSGPADWGIDMNEFNSGSASSKSGSIGDDESSDISITLEVTADGEIDFYYKVSAEYPTSGDYFYDGLEFYIDNTLIGQYQSTTNGGSPWSNVYYPVTAGEHTFTWSYVKDGAGGTTDCFQTNCADAAWIDDIQFPPCVGSSGVLLGGN
jgi:hypothetical protein